MSREAIRHISVRLKMITNHRDVDLTLTPEEDESDEDYLARVKREIDEIVSEVLDD